MILSLFGSPCSTEKDKERGGGGAFKKFCRFRPSPPSRLSGSRKATEEDVSLKVMPPPPLKWGKGTAKKKKLAILGPASSVNARHLFKELDIILLLGSRVLSSSAAVASATEKKVCRVTERRKEEWKDNGTLEVLVVYSAALFVPLVPALSPTVFTIAQSHQEYLRNRFWWFFLRCHAADYARLHSFFCI